MTPAKIPLLALVGLLLLGCSDTGGPKELGLDPTVLITNRTTTDTVFFTWRDGQGIAGDVTVLPNAESCTRFLARPDSAYFEATSTREGTSYQQPWFDPSERAAWTMTYYTYGFLVKDEPTEPC